MSNVWLEIKADSTSSLSGLLQRVKCHRVLWKLYGRSAVDKNQIEKDKEEEEEEEEEEEGEGEEEEEDCLCTMTWGKWVWVYAFQKIWTE